ncbi:hypothetical protein K9L67_04120 [Candidatus Woesearchaeota archaeon]|nr:hypothetical protein [Candidatus Woesearchaeota archaeon]MCF7901388.1 hypothetical protein [Candidatus Woesearchaeota archaeon]MCF8013141.1 hypothetical protein [Candidatus Woesearchaeota archaeon]
MLKTIMNLFDKKEYMAWQEYNEKMQFMENFYWQQNIRKKSLKNTI